MIDIHSHILADIDDGARDWEESIKMAQEAYKNGVRHIIATPHLRLSDANMDSIKKMERRVSQFRKILEDKKIQLTIHQGAELEMEMEIIDYIEKDIKEIYAGNNDKDKFILIHFPLSMIPLYIKNLIFMIVSKGVTPILAHPERNSEISKNLNLIKELSSMGAMIQVNAGSVLGAYGKDPQKNATHFIKNRWVHLIATDSHSPKSRSLKDGIKKSQGIEKDIERKVLQNSSRVLGLPLQ
jgi:protein-tyrosine phosphatase